MKNLLSTIDYENITGRSFQDDFDELQKRMNALKTCQLCGYTGPAIDDHHIYGRKTSSETIRVCCNCHREIHAGVRKI